MSFPGCGLRVYGVRVVEKPGRFPEERNYEYYLRDQRIAVVKAFYGRPPYYRMWAEVFAVAKRVGRGCMAAPFAGSIYEDTLYTCIAGWLEPGGWLYVEYLYDESTMRLLEKGVPPVLTRLGFMLYMKGFRWFKDWYYPEGFMEGGPKLQAEKPLNREVEEKYMRGLCRAVSEYVAGGNGPGEAAERASLILGECRRRGFLG